MVALEIELTAYGSNSSLSDVLMMDGWMGINPLACLMVRTRKKTMNIYRHLFKRACPNNGLMIAYQLVIVSPEVLIVESIVQEVQNLPEKGFHEEFADTLTRSLPGKHILTAHHHGVDIQTVRGGA